LLVVELELDNIKTFSRREQYQMFNYLTDLGGFGVALFFLFSALGGMISRVAFRLALLNDVYDT
jgi:hypothetical protein